MATRKRDIEYRDVETARGMLRYLRQYDDVSLSRARDIAKDFPKNFQLDDDHFSGDDLVYVSNYRSWKREFEKTQGKNWWDASGAILIRLDSIHKTEEEEALDALENYPLFDESDHSDLEMETQVENWNDYGRSDLRREIDDQSNEVDAEVIGTLMETITDEMLDTFAHETWEASGNYPEQEGGTTATIFPNILEDWDGSLLQLGDLFSLGEHGYVVEVRLSPAAFSRGRIILRPQDLPEIVKSLVYNPTPIQVEYDASLCDSPYLTCVWTGEKELKARAQQEDYDARQLRLPGVAERRRRENPISPEIQKSLRAYLDKLGSAEYAAWRKKKRKKSERFSPSEYHQALIDYLNRGDEEGFKNLKQLQGYASALGY